MADLLTQYATNKYTSDMMGDVVDHLMERAEDGRRSFERRWYDNNFFDDGLHFRYYSRQQNKIVDLTDRASIYNPLRAIPKASRQLRGMANLLVSRNFVPIVYPEKVSSAQYPMQEMEDPNTGQMVQQPNPEYKQALEEAKRVARLSGHYVEEEFKKQSILEKLALMIILTGKHSVSYMQIWPDTLEEAIKTPVFDAFDIYLLGHLTELTDCPFIGKATKRRIADIKNDDRFDLEKTMKINPDNRLASSEIKEAYEKARHGGVTGNPDEIASVIEKEFFIKEYLDSSNTPRIKQQKNGQEILQTREEGDPVIRHIFSAGNVELLDEYVDLPDYPFVDYRMEPGPIYQVPLIERFIPANKSLDLISSRIERYTHTMVTGSWSVKTGEPAEPNNTAGGQIFNYQTTPPIQNPITSIPQFVFQYMQFLTGLMEEQGVTTTALGKIPPGVKAHAAIESLKESEFANLAIPSERLKGTVKRIAEKMLDLVDRYFVSEQTVYYLERGEPQYFDIIGYSALQKRQDLNLGVAPNTIPIKKDYRVEIEIQAGLAYTKEGQKQAAKELGDYLIQLAQMGLVSPEVIKVYFERLLDIYQFGASQEIMEAMEQFQGAGMQTDKQVDATKVAVMEVMKDLQGAGILPTSEQRIEEGKVATAETIKDIAQKGGEVNGQAQATEQPI